MKYERIFEGDYDLEYARLILTRDFHFMQEILANEQMRRGQRAFYENPCAPGIRFDLNRKLKIISDISFDEVKGFSKIVLNELEKELNARLK